MIKRYAALAFAVLLLASCVSTPAQSKAPAWTLSTPSPDGTYTYFVGYSADPTGDAAKATEGATANLLASIMNYIGVKISVDSSATARASYDSYQAEVVQTVRTQSTNRLAGFMVKDKHQIKEKGGRVTVYILASYITRDLEAEKTRIQKLFQEKIDAVAVPELKGQSLEGEGRYFEAVQSYIEAAVAASGADIDNADIKLERNVNNARRVLQRLRFVAAGPAPKAGLGQPFSGPFAARLVYGENDSGPGIPGAEAYVSYQVRQASGRLTGKTERAVSDSRGSFAFTPPPPNFVGKAKLTMRLNLDSSLALLDKFPARFESFRSSLETELRGRTIEFEYTVVSIAKDVATGIALVDLDEKGAAIPGTQAQAGLIEALIREKFKVQAAPLDAALLSGGDDAAILAAAQRLYKARFGRIVAGVARIEGVRKDGANFMVSVRASVKCWDLATGDILYSTDKAYTGVGPDEAAARRASLQQLGRDTLGRDLMANLP